MGLTGDEVERSRCGGSEDGIVGIIAHRKVLGVVPECCDRVSVVVVHHNRLVGATASADALNKMIHQSMVESQLFILVVVILIAGQSLGTIKPLRVCQVRIGCKQSRVEPVDRRCIPRCIEVRLAGRVLCERVGTEIVVERNVLVENNNKVFDGSSSGTGTTI